MSLCRICALIAIAFLLRIIFGGYRPEEALQLVVRNLWRYYDWRALNRSLVVQTGVSASQAKVFKAHAAPQGLCENMINALELGEPAEGW